MQWVWQELSFRGRRFRAAHFEAPAPDQEAVPEELIEPLERCEAELGACLWHDTNDMLLNFLERRHADGFAGLRLLELGAGAGVIGLALATDGADALVTDLDALVPLLEFNVAQNGFGEAGNGAAGDSDGEGLGGGGGGATSSGRGAAKAKKGRRKAGGRRGRGGDSDDDHDFGIAEEQLDGGGGESPAAGTAGASPSKPSARERREARALARQQKAKAAAGPEEAQDGSAPNESAPVAPGGAGRCRAQRCDWLQEARDPALPEGGFDIIVVCDCLYENKASWEALLAVVGRALALGGASELVLASATIRRPFLEEFADLCESSGFRRDGGEVTELAEVAVLRRR